MSALKRTKICLSCLRQNYLIWRQRLWRSHSYQSKLNVTTNNCGSDRPFYITTPIFYVNAAPHIGHLYTVLLADVAARWQRLSGRKVVFSTGTDEHGLKIQQAAEKHGTSPKQYCQEVSALFKALFDQSGITYDDFIRTTEPRHSVAVHKFWEELSRRGYIYKGSYEGWYCVSDEAFLTEKEVQDSVSPAGQHIKVSVSSGQPVHWMTEENYMFRLTAFLPHLNSWLDSEAVRPAQFASLVRSWLDDLQDLSVSRQRKRLNWGIPVPGDDSQTIYVWLDALVNYLTVAGYPNNPGPISWPATCHVIGKDILRFHAVYWPAFLFAADMAPPMSVLCHSHWMVEGQKMSKSQGNVVDPLERMKRFTVDGLRYFLLREGSCGSDGSYSDARAIERINNDLVNSIGNLLNRITAPSINKWQEFPALETDVQFLSESDVKMYNLLQKLPEQIDELYHRFAFPQAIDLLLGHVYWANAFVQKHQPWTLVKMEDSASEQHLRAVLHVAMETLRICGILLQPIVPHLTDRLLTRLGISVGHRQIAYVQNICKCAHPLGEKVILLRRIEPEKS